MIRELRADDLASVVSIEQDSFTDPWSARMFETVLSMPHTRALVCETDDVICGYLIASVVLDSAEVLNIAVAPHARGRGFARALLANCFSETTAAGVNTWYLEVRASNTAARALYISEGFCEAGTRRNYYQNPREDAILMTKTSEETQR